MGRLSPGEFLLELNKLYDMNKDKGSVYVEMKRTNFRSRLWNKKHPEEKEKYPCKCLVRAYDGKKCKISTEIDQRELQGRFLKEIQVYMKANMDGLKKRVRAKGKGKGKA
eukprot:jgi/Ulvmu1/9823/UM056_0064.1